MAVSSHEVMAAEELVKLERSIPFRDIAVTALAVHVMWFDRPNRFQDHIAFQFQLVRRIRALADLAVYRIWSVKRRAMRRVYRDFPPRAVAPLACLLKEPFWEAALYLHEQEKARPMLKAAESQALAAAVKDLH